MVTELVHWPVFFVGNFRFIFFSFFLFIGVILFAPFFVE